MKKEGSSMYTNSFAQTSSFYFCKLILREESNK